jgi:hypothetical protein
MDSGTFPEYLAGLDKVALVRLLQARPDVRTEPAPTGFAQLAERLGGADSLASALRMVSRDCVVVGQAVAALGPSATVSNVARLLDAAESAVLDLVADLCGRGLAWIDAGTVRLPERLEAHFSAEIGGGRPVGTIARSVLVDDLRGAAAALGAAVDGLRKPELIARVAQALADVPAVAKIVAGLPKPARVQLDQLRHGSGLDYGYYGASRGGSGATALLAAAGLVLRVNSRWELPQEVAVAAWLAEWDVPLTGPPDIPPAAAAPAEVLATAQAAAQDLVRAVISLLDEAGSAPIAALKKGGVGARERSRLAARLGLSTDIVLLAIDLTYAAGLLGRAETGYVPTSEYPAWRDADPAHQWAVLVTTWFALDHAPTSREVQGDKELPPPLVFASGAGMIRRALLRAARGGRAVDAAVKHVDWFCPLHGYDGTQTEEKVTAAIREGRHLGVLAADVLTDCGEHLISVAGDDPGDLVQDLAGRVASLFPETRCTVILQSDLTAVVSGHPSVAVSRLLADAAVCETRGTASVWRFRPESIRHALDGGWEAGNLRAELAALSGQPLPQPLDYLITDVARKHGQVRVRGMRSAVLADETTVTEILHTRGLAKLQLARLAPTVLSSPHELDEVLAKIRAAGFAPVAEDAQGAVIVEDRHDHEAPGTIRPKPAATRTRLSSADLAGRLLADPDGGTDSGSGTSDTFERLAVLNTRLPDAELALLADALDHRRDVLITYRNKKGSRTRREIQPRELYGRWLESWCHLRNGEREFTVANIESVAPA